MASETTPLDLIGLAKPLSERERGKLRENLRRLLRFHSSLTRFPRIAHAPLASPIVAIYGNGRMHGCALSRLDASGSKRLVRAFLAASGNVGLSRDEADLSAEVNYARKFRWVEDPASIEVGSEGVALVGSEPGPVLLMPQVARDWGVDASGLIALLSEKAGQRVQGARLAAWTTDRVVGRLTSEEDESSAAAAKTEATEADYAAAWLARLVQADGSMVFAIDPVRRILQPTGELHHARAAVAIEALAKHGGYASEVRRARRALDRDIERALAGGAVEGWPLEKEKAAGTLALAVWAGVDVRAILRKWVEDDFLVSHPWQAAQVALALGRETPRTLWNACLADLGRTSFAPWTALAAKSVGDEVGYRRAAAALTSSIATTRPHEGGVNVTRVPECGLTAVAAHALVGAKEHRDVAKKAIRFVRRRQLLPGSIPAAVDPGLALGGFSATPVNDLLRGDIVGHALSLLLEAGR